MNNTLQRPTRSYNSSKANEYRKRSLPHAFISYSHHDGMQYAQDIYSKLLIKDFSVWMDDSLIIGQNYDKEIEEAIRECDIIIYVVTPDAVTSDYIIKKELEWAKKYGKTVLPVVVEIPNKAAFDELTKKTEEIIEHPIVCYRYSTAESFIEQILKAADSFIVSSDIITEVEAAVKAQKHLRIYDWPLYDRYLIALAYIKGIVLEEDKKLGTEMLTNIIQTPAKFLSEDETHTVSLAQMELGHNILVGSTDDEERAAGLQHYIDALNSGNSSAGNVLYYIFYTGQYGIDIDKEKAFGYCLQAANMGDSYAMLNCGYFEYHRKRYNASIKWYKNAAKKGNVHAMTVLGDVYKKGIWGEKVNNDRAVGWYRQAADYGSCYSMIELGKMYRDGTFGLPVDGKKCLFWFDKAAKLGDTFAMGEIGKIYRDGSFGIPADADLSVEWFEKAAGLGDAFAMGELGVLYRDGSAGISVSGDKAVEWFEKAAGLGDTFSMIQLGKIYRDGLCGIPINGSKAVEWFIKAAKYNDRYAMGELGKIYRDGLCGIPINGSKAVEWFKKAVKHNDLYAMGELGKIYRDGVAGIPADGAKAIEWFEKASKKGDRFSMASLGLIYRDGLAGIPADGVKAVRWFEKAVKRGDKFSMASLGLIYRDGLAGIHADGVKAVEWFEKAAKKGDYYSMAELGKIYRYGLAGIPADGAKAVEWFEKAAKEKKVTQSKIMSMYALYNIYRNGDSSVQVDEQTAALWLEKARKANAARGAKAFYEEEMLNDKEVALIRTCPEQTDTEASAYEAHLQKPDTEGSDHVKQRRSAAGWLLPLIILFGLIAAIVVLQRSGLFRFI